MNIKNAIFALFLSIPFNLPAQQNELQKAPNAEYIIPFLLTGYNNLSVKGVLNGTDTVALMFHTAAGSMTLTEEAVKRLSSVTFDELTHGVKSWGGQSNDSRMSKGNALKIGEETWEDLPIWENTNTGQGTDGKFGLGLFENRVVEIDFEAQKITVREALPDGIENYEKLAMVFENDNLFVEAACEVEGQIFRNKFLIHSGYSGAILLDDDFVKENAIDGKLEVIGEKELKDSYGNVLVTKKVTLPTVRIGEQELINVPAGYFQGAIGRQKMSVIGGDVLKRFNIIIDGQRQFVYLKPNRFKNDAYSNI
ncbi:aspartyl protease family protein [Olivibacter sp. XZL3]|uniref:aspartyl protease family protein n=1 Tax=Olivibacter sp. XZL3 TaxID=1735116 RepID=UPI001066E6C5|nr:aspartyl protease family protein [Olivibacter sp. XZL3]